MNRSGPEGSRSGHLVAEELRSALDLFPELPFSDAFIAAIRTADPAELSPFPAGELPPELAAIDCREMFVPRADGDGSVRFLLYVPDIGAKPLPACLHIHGGGFILGSADMSDRASRKMALEQGCAVASVDYRLAPETRFPGARDDCYAVLKWLHDKGATLGIDPSRLFVAGESAGGGHALSLAFHSRDMGEVSIRLLLLDAPMLDDRTGSGSEPHEFAGEFVWSAASNRFGWTALLGVEAGSEAVPTAAVPARRPILQGLPPTFISVGALDLFAEEDMEFARRLMRAGVPTELHVVPGAYHGFGAAGPDSPLVRSVARLRSEAIARALTAPSV